MPDEKISQLPPVTTVAVSDLAVAVASGVTSKITEQNLINALVSFITAAVNVGGGKVVLNPDGSVVMSGGLFNLDASGNLITNGLVEGAIASFAGGRVVIDGSGSITLSGSVTNSGSTFQLSSDGSAEFGTSALTIDPSGNLITNGSGSFAGGSTLFNLDGSVVFDSGAITIDPAGNLTTSGVISADSGDWEINADGSANFGAANVTISASGAVVLTSTLTPTGGIVGTTAVGNATAGNLGEFVSSLVASGAATGLTTATAKNVTSIALTAGDWDVEGNVNFAATTATATGATGGISATSATLPTDGSEVYSGLQTTLLSDTNSVTMPRKRINVSANTTVYLVAKATFSAGTVSAFGSINARRVR